MTSAPEVVFMCDTDALAQIFISGHYELFDQLGLRYGVHCFLMSEVETELLSNRKIAGLVRPRYEKALKAGSLKVLSSADAEQLSAGLNTEVTLAAIRHLAADLKLHVGIGEAHTHAASILLGCPSVSNDGKALKVLEANSKPLPCTVLRSFDLFAFLYQESLLSQESVEQLRKTLFGHGEWVPASMKNSSFVQGLSELHCRLSTSMAATGGSGGWSQPFYLKRV